MNNIKPEFVEIKTKDGLLLPGLFYEPKRAKAAVIYLHGNGSSSVFYKGKENYPMIAALQKKGITILYFNNRGAHIIKGLSMKRGGKTKRRYFGMAYEKIKECVPDIDGAVSFLKKRGYKKFYLMGSSTGANKICVYNFYKPKNEISKYVLLSGGDDTGIYYRILGRSRFWKLLTEAKKKRNKKEGLKLVTDAYPEGLFSYKGFYDIANPDGDYNVFPFFEALGKVKLSKRPLFRYFKSIKKPALVVYGDKDQFFWKRNVRKAVGLLRSYQPELTYKVIKGANHGFKGHTKELANTIANWLA